METIKDYKNLIGKKSLLKGISSIISVYGIYRSINALNKCVDNEENDNMFENIKDDYINQNINNINKREKKNKNTDIIVLDKVSTEKNINKKLEYLRNSLNSRISYHNTYNNLSDREMKLESYNGNAELESENENTELESENESIELGSENENTELESENESIELGLENENTELESEKGNTKSELESELDNESLESFSWKINIDDLRDYRNNFLLLQENNIISPINSLSYFMREQKISFSDITEIYKLCNYDSNRPLTLNIFCAISHIIKNIQNGNQIPKSIPTF